LIARTRLDLGFIYLRSIFVHYTFYRWYGRSNQQIYIPENIMDAQHTLAFQHFYNIGKQLITEVIYGKKFCKIDKVSTSLPAYIHIIHITRWPKKKQYFGRTRYTMIIYNDTVKMLNQLKYLRSAKKTREHGITNVKPNQTMKKNRRKGKKLVFADKNSYEKWNKTVRNYSHVNICRLIENFISIMISQHFSFTDEICNITSQNYCFEAKSTKN